MGRKKEPAEPACLDIVEVLRQHHFTGSGEWKGGRIVASHYCFLQVSLLQVVDGKQEPLPLHHHYLNKVLGGQLGEWAGASSPIHH